MENDEFRKRSEELWGYIPDNSSEISDTIETRLGKIDTADVPTVISSINNNNQRNIWTNKNYNEVFVRRRKWYYYTVAANDYYR